MSRAKLFVMSPVHALLKMCIVNGDLNLSQR